VDVEGLVDGVELDEVVELLELVLGPVLLSTKPDPPMPLELLSARWMHPVRVTGEP
jgi:hypothetical protein